MEDKQTWLSYLEIGDYQNEFREAERQASLGNSEAMFHLSSLYLLGRGTEKDHTKMLYWCKKAAELGNGLASYFLGYYFETGLYTTKDIGASLVWYEKSARLGNLTAAFNLANLMLSYFQDPQCAMKAYAWGRISEMGGVSGSAKIVKKARSIMGPDLVPKAEGELSTITGSYPEIRASILEAELNEER